jgi:hypothetical protein
MKKRRQLQKQLNNLEENIAMASIKENITKVEKAMADPAKKAGLGLVLKNAAVEAIMKGIGSNEWITYMAMFADNQEQLDRLTVVTPNDKPWLKEARAYIVSNSVCAPSTNTQTGNGIFNSIIEPEIDKGLGTSAQTKIKNLRPKDFNNLVP